MKANKYDDDDDDDDDDDEQSYEGKLFTMSYVSVGNSRGKLYAKNGFPL